MTESVRHGAPELSEGTVAASRTGRRDRSPRWSHRSTMRLGVPTLAVLVVQAFVGVAEAYFVSSLGTDVLRVVWAKSWGVRLHEANPCHA